MVAPGNVADLKQLRQMKRYQLEKVFCFLFLFATLPRVQCEPELLGGMLWAIRRPALGLVLPILAFVKTSGSSDTLLMAFFPHSLRWRAPIVSPVHAVAQRPLRSEREAGFSLTVLPFPDEFDYRFMLGRFCLTASVS